MIRKGLILLITIWLLAFSAGAQVNFTSPLKIPLSMSASFGELRPDHFHSGVDFKTEGVTGKEVVAADDGFVYLLLVSPVGYGHAIFIRHPSGYSTVYGHLERYAPEIEEYVKIQQYKNRSFAVSIYPPEERLPVKKGQIIGYSGNTGGSSGPHLHFEVRKTNGEKPVNPLQFGFGIEDNLKPVIERLVVYPGSGNALINNRSGKLFMDIAGSNGHYYLPSGAHIKISGTAGFGITAYDYMNNTANRFGINTIELVIDSIPWFTYEMDEFSFSESKYINAHTDYEASVRYNMDVEKTFILPNDRLSLYRNYMNNGFYDFNDGKVHLVSITVKDSKGNKTTLSFKVEPADPSLRTQVERPDSSVIIMPFGKTNTFNNDKVRVQIPAGALYDTLHFRYLSFPGDQRMFSGIHQIAGRITPLHKPFTLSLKPDSFPAGLEKKLILVQVDEKGRISYSGGTFSAGFITADVSSFGAFAVSIDTIPPDISANGLTDGADFSLKSSIRLRISDDLSGIKAYSGTIDGNWVLFEYDAKNNLIFYRFDPQKLQNGLNHKLEVTVTDNRDNSSTLTRYFKW
jgi:hypothetical protein